jgi:hypothetical protein
VNVQPPLASLEWPAHLEPPLSDEGRAVKTAWRESRGASPVKPAAPWRTRRRIYLTGAFIPGGRETGQWRKSLRVRK